VRELFAAAPPSSAVLAARTKERTAALAAASSPGQAGPATAPGLARPEPWELPADVAALTGRSAELGALLPAVLPAW
jgi:hypothetical protein